MPCIVFHGFIDHHTTALTKSSDWRQVLGSFGVCVEDVSGRCMRGFGGFVGTLLGDVRAMLGHIIHIHIYIYICIYIYIYTHTQYTCRHIYIYIYI